MHLVQFYIFSVPFCKLKSIIDEILLSNNHFYRWNYDELYHNIQCEMSYQNLFDKLSTFVLKLAGILDMLARFISLIFANRVIKINYNTCLKNVHFIIIKNPL